MSTDTPVGSEVAGYRIDSLIGRGGMGVVYLAEHLRLKRKVALKVLAPEVSGDERFRERFVIESELAASLEHPNIVPIYDAGEADGLLYIAMRFIEGTDLKTLIEREGSLEPDRTVAVISQVASALDAAHDKGLIHRDVKPANVLLGRQDHAYLTDFGLTKRPDQTTGLTKTGQFMGSVDYAAPEQFEGKPLDARTDVYSLACVAYECLTGEVPFRREQEAAVMYAHLRSPPPRVSAIREGLPAAIDPVLARGMAKKPEDRYGSAGGMAQALRSALPGSPSGLPPVGRARRRRTLVAAAVGLALVAGGVAAALLSGDGKSPAPPGPSPPRAASGAFAGVIQLGPDGHPVGSPVAIPFVHSNTTFEAQIAVGAGFVWANDSATVRKINHSSHAVLFTAPVRQGIGFAFGDDAVWVAQGSPVFNAHALVSLNPRTNTVSKPIELGTTCCGGVAYADGSVWVLSSNSLVRIDPGSGRILATIDTGGERIVSAGGALWVLKAFEGVLSKVDPHTGQTVQDISLSGTPSAVVIGFGAAWVADTGGTVARIPLSGQGGTDTIEVGKRPNDIAVGDGVVWVANSGDGTVSMIPSSGGVATSFRVGGVPTHLAVGEGGVWVLVELSQPNPAG